MGEIDKLTREQLTAALAAADLRVLLMVMYHLSGEERWLQEPYRPRRDVRLIADEDAGFSPQLQQEVRAAALELLTAAAISPAISRPDETLLQRMMSVCLGEEVPAEYAPMMLEQMGFEPLLRELPPLRTPLTGELLPVIIVGAGVSGIALGKFLLEAGIEFQILDKNTEVGGTWWENVYPGCGVDTPNHAYSYSFGPRFAWSSFFSPRADIQDYLQLTAQNNGLYPHIRFSSTIEGAVWEESEQCWHVTVSGQQGRETLRARALVSAVGQLNLPALPSIEGLEDFDGPLFHSSRWPAGLELSGKRVAVVGTGASAMQIVPTIAGEVEHLTIFQRTPQWARPIPRYHESINEAARTLLDHVPFYAAWLRFTMFWRYGDGLLPYLRKDPQWSHPQRSMNRINDRHREEMLAHIEQKLAGRSDLLDKCVPDYPPYGKRILLDNGWFDTLLESNVTLQTDPISAVHPRGIATAAGGVEKFDVVILATGFQVGKMAARLNITGRDSRQLAAEWAHDNPTAHLGITVAGFPNLFCMMGPSTGLGHGGSAMFQAEVQARYIVDCLLTLFNSNAGSMEVLADVQADFVARVDAEHEQLIWSHPKLQSYYRNAGGRVFSLLPWRIVDYWQMTRHLQLDDFEWSGAAQLNLTGVAAGE
ncbi:flavin-containing monooxygenase [Candidatus Litorirhabdus singularis]|uniref:flavin-containing monooxygenase n=1 Tax=Candidatus Litorirhabdus singularis TaxID=2518993 RepID=UPI00242B9136|nr:NAD(P)/FAD-dependent oxidoreductase [Candidatus Litorirhabdus singularis]